MTIKTRKPAALYTASNQRIMSIHEDDNQVDAVISTFLRGLIPWRLSKGTRNFHAFDVVITGDNPLLAAMLASSAAERGLDVAITKPNIVDDWPYDLAISKSGGALIASALKLPAQDDVDGVPRSLGVLRSLMTQGRSVFTLLIASGFSVSEKHPDGELALYPIVKDDRPIFPPSQLSFVNPFLANTFGFRQAKCLPDKKTAVFTKRLVLTAMPQSLSRTKVVSGEYGGRISWDAPGIVSVGSALNDVPNGRSAAKTMIEDLLMCSRGTPLEGL